MSSAKAFLCSQDGVFNFPLAQKLTTIGRENCDIIINNNTVDLQHAVIEHIEDDNCFIIQDLNSANGTYINDCRVQNAAVRLAEHDVVRFGFNGIPFQFIMQPQTTQLPTIPPINMTGFQRTSMNQPLQIINQTVPLGATSSPFGIGTTNVVWQATPVQLPPNSLVSISTTQQQQQQAIKPPASLRSRPSSSNSRKSVTKETAASASKTPTTWVRAYSGSASPSVINPLNVNLNSPSHQNFTATIAVNSETYRQEDDTMTNDRLYQMEKELKLKNMEIKDLKEKLSFYQTQHNFGSGQTAEMEQLRRDKSMAVGLVNSMQKDMQKKDSTISKMGRDVENQRKEIQDKEKLIKELQEKINSLDNSEKQSEEARNREKELIVLQTKIKQTDNKVIEMNNQILQIKNDLEESNKQNERLAQAEKTLRDELEHQKTLYIDMQRAERTLRIDLEQTRRSFEKFRGQIIQAIYSVPGTPKPTGEVTDDELLAQWKKLVNERTDFTERLEAMKDSLKENEEMHAEFIQNVNNIESQMIGIEGRLLVSGRRAQNLEKEIKKLQTNSIHKSLSKLQECMCKLYMNEMTWQAEIERNLQSIGCEWNAEETFGTVIEKVNAKLKESSRQKDQFEAKIKELENLHAERMRLELDKQTDTFKASVTELEVTLKSTYESQIANIKRSHEEFISLLKETHESEASRLKEELEKATLKIASLTSEIELVKSQLDIVRSEDRTAELSEQLAKVRQEIVDLEIMKVQSINEYEIRLNEALNSYNLELSIHKEQIKQHSLTIVNFEKDLKHLRELELTQSAEIESLRRKLRESETRKSTTSTSQVLRSVSEHESSSLERANETLRTEIRELKARTSDQEEQIKSLRRDLAGASAKLSDVQGEMSEKSKRELERNRQLVIDQQRELSDARSQMAKLSEIVDKQNKQLEAVNCELSKSKQLVEKYRATSQENGNLAVELKAKLDDVESQLKNYDSIRREEGKITTELTALGAQCKGERHEQVINRQREALNELRQRVKSLEQTRPAIPTQQQQMQQQIMLLKKQLAEVRASQALTEDIVKQANMARGNDDGFLMLEEKTAHHETQTALDFSEESYFTMMRAIGGLLEVDELDGMRSMANLPLDERQKLSVDRQKAIETMCIRIKTLMEKLQRKENLLRDYEIDLAKLRQAEFLLDKKAEQLNSSEMYSRTKDDEIEFLKESLKNAKAELEREKLLNTAIKQKKSIGSVQTLTDRVRRASTDTLHHHCPPEDKSSHQVKKTLNEKIKRKDYELRAIKAELKNKTEELSNLSSRHAVSQNASSHSVSFASNTFHNEK